MIKLPFLSAPAKDPTPARMDLFPGLYGLQPGAHGPDAARRLLVLVLPHPDNLSMMHGILDLARATGLPVRLLGLCKAAEEEPGLRRQLVTLSALLGNGGVSTEIEIEAGPDWVQAVRAGYRPGDMIVYLSDPTPERLQRRLKPFLDANPDVPVFILSGANPGRSSPRLITEPVVWTGFLAILLGCSAVQVRIAQLPQDGFQSLLFVLSTLFEFWLLWTWNGFFQ